MSEQPANPVKTRDIHNHHMDSTAWDDVVFRDDDIVIGTWAKSGTTWMQQIVGQLTRGPDPDLMTQAMSPWVDMRLPPKGDKLAMIEELTSPRFLKTHLPVDALVFSPRAKYIYVGRDGRDVVWSMHNHHTHYTPEFYEAINETPGLVGPKLATAPADIREFWRDWLAGEGYPYWSFWENIRSWWQVRELPYVRLVHFNDLKRDMAGQMRLIAEFLEIDVPDDDWPRLLEYCSFDWMREHGDRTAPRGGAPWLGGAKTFINKGVNGRWQRVLSAEDSAEYEAKALAELGADCAAWLKDGTR